VGLADVEHRRASVRIEGRSGLVVDEVEPSRRGVDGQAILEAGAAADDGAEGVGRGLEGLDAQH
jgi:hypothetical protein